MRSLILNIFPYIISYIYIIARIFFRMEEYGPSVRSLILMRLPYSIVYKILKKKPGTSMRSLILNFPYIILYIPYEDHQKQQRLGESMGSLILMILPCILNEILIDFLFKTRTNVDINEIPDSVHLYMTSL